MGIVAWLRGEEPGIISQIAHCRDRGQFGEYLTEFAMGNGNLPGTYSLYIPHRGQTTEVDVLMLHERGVWVVESKNYSGWIFGSAGQR